MALDETKRTFGGVVVEIGPWDMDTNTPPTYPDDYFDPGDVKKFTEALKTEKIEDFTYYTGEKTLLCQDVISKGYELTMELGQIDQNTLSIAYMGTNVGTNEIQPLTQPLGVFAVKVTPKFPRGQKWIRHYYKVSLLMTGSLDLISGTYISLTLTGSGLIDVTNHPTNPYFSVVLAT